MKSNAPWSVKGIERDARETAKEAARREGMTVGEWLNKMIYAAGDDEGSGGEVEGLKLRDVVTAIEHLSKRLHDSQTASANGVETLTRQMGGVVERLQRLERSGPGEGADDRGLEERVARLEDQGGARERVDALKALERAVSQVAVQFDAAQKAADERIAATDERIDRLAQKIEAASGGDAADAAFLKNAIDGLTTRMTRTERLAQEARQAASQTASTDAPDQEFVETTGNRLRVLGDEIKRGGDQIRGLETTISKLSQQIEAAERRSAEAVQKTTEALNDLRGKVAEAKAPPREQIEAMVADAAREAKTELSELRAKMTAFESRAPVSKPETAPSFDAEEERGAHPDDDDAGERAQKDIEAAPARDTEPSASDDQDDDDFFSFADDIDAALDEPGASARGDDEDFSFELEDGPGQDDSENEGGGADLLSEVQEIFGKRRAPTEDDAKDAPLADAPASDVDDLLSGFGADDDEAPPTAAAADGQGVDVSNADGDDEAGDPAPPPRATSAPPGARPTRRQLTPKQKAILAARARKKRLEAMTAESGEATEGDDQRRSAAHAARAALRGEEALNAPRVETDHSASAPEFDDDAEEDDRARTGLFARIGAVGLLNRGRSRKSLLEEDSDAEAERAPIGPNDRNEDGDRAAMETMRRTVAARPVTLALGLGIMLSAGLLFFMIKDMIFPPRPNAPAPARAAVNAPAPAAESPSPAAPAEIGSDPAPAIDPRTLYRDAMTGLGAAQTEAETAAAIDKLREAALLGHPPSQLQLGELYKTGQGVDQDLAQARTWFRRAANGGNVLAMHRIGVMTARGEGGPANAEEAVGWFELAGNSGLVDSQYNLGAIYHPSGEGETAPLQDAGKAYYWYSLAAKNGDDQASPLAAGVGADLSTDEKARIDQEVADWTATPADAEANELIPPQ